MSDVSVYTPYSGAKPFFIERVEWVNPEEADRIASYQFYEELYWNNTPALRLAMRGTHDKPIYLPSARTVVDETSHYLLKGLHVGLATPNTEAQEALDTFLVREQFYSRFAVAKHAGVVRGDWVFHLMGDPERPEGRRLSLVSVDPASYFPIYDEEDPDKIIGVDLAEQIISPEDQKVRVKRLRYMKHDGTWDDIGTPEEPVISRTEGVYELKDWWNGAAAQVFVISLEEEFLDDRIQSIPVYAFRNGMWQGDPFGSSELRGFERLFGGINQAASDEDVALALEGIGVYATDAPPPTGENGEEEDWEIAPGKVLEVPAQSYFKRIEGVKSVAPFLEHIAMLQKGLFEGAGVFRNSSVDVQLAESGIALAIRFMPTLAKIEHRDLVALDLLRHLFYDWKVWHAVFENQDFIEDVEIEVTLGEKLPVDHVAVLNELNNFLDRKIISREEYRRQLEKKLGYKFSGDQMKEILEEEKMLAEARAITAPPGASNSNNSNFPNESGGTEADQDAEDQQRPQR